MNSLTHHCLTSAYINLKVFAQQEKYVRVLCLDWIDGLYKMNSHAEDDVITHNIHKINSMYGLGIIDTITDKNYYPPRKINANILVDLTEFKNLPKKSKALLLIIVNAYHKNYGSSLFALALNTLIHCKMINNIETIKRKATIDLALGNIKDSTSSVS